MPHKKCHLLSGYTPTAIVANVFSCQLKAAYSINFGHEKVTLRSESMEFLDESV